MIIQLKQLDELCKGDQEKKKKYLAQFLQLVPPRIQQIKKALEAHDQKSLRQTMHFLAPQLAFFGIPDFVNILETTRGRQEAITSEQLKPVLKKIALAISEIERLLNDNSPRSF